MNNTLKIRQALSEQDYPALLITNPVSRLYATGFSSSAGVLFVTVDNAWFFTDSRYIEAAGAAIQDAHVRIVNKDGSYFDQIISLIKTHDITSVGFEEGAVTYSAYLQWAEKLETKLVPAQKLIDSLRAVKSRNDMEKMKQAQRLAEKILVAIIPTISTDMTEKQLATELVCSALRSGADDKAFDPIIVSGVRSSLPHGTPSDQRIGNGFLTIDFGVRLDNWCSDMTRTLCIGKPSDEMIRVYDTVLKAQEAGITAVRGGVSGFDVDAAARSVIEDAGYGEYFGHGFGHSMGLEVHEALKASQISEDILPTGSVISAEPGIYLPGRFGVRIEDVLYVTERGCENITNMTKELIVL